MEPLERQWTIGQHTFHFEAPDLLWSKHQGYCTLDEAMRMVSLYRELGGIRPFFLLSDMEQAEGMESEAKRYVSENLRPEWLLGVIYFNARLLHKALARGLLLAAQLSRSEDDPPRTEVHFVSTRDSARALSDQLRARREEHRV
ncbi:hypothetical protein D187_001325 [Cystobacter fuscus DSM 2262]|uniref:Uncharacterized protein n=1 Tax=Cystobacter fuscus (strain ATCC 25194 / DSM 2262 / NBRC 100088 / M29) TaxID=1242864 RepID=S9PC79_CYSF2|nr:hypothetical protein [Cystobacter fuscus]EPX60676.1 hypothetical protein D187_001325 [Cystobacter fuscus DSM 2262]